MACEPGDWTRVHTILRYEKIDGIKLQIEEEAVNCGACHKFLLASPDDEIDPLQPGELYDPNIYHKFVRPDGWEAPRQNVLNRPPRKEDWVVVWDDFTYMKNDRPHQLKGAEGKVIQLDQDTANLLLAGFGGIEKNTSVPVPIKHLKVIQFDSFTIDSRVRIIRGKYRDCTGTVLSFQSGDITIKMDTEPSIIATLPMEHLQRISTE